MSGISLSEAIEELFTAGEIGEKYKMMVGLNNDPNKMDVEIDEASDNNDNDPDVAQIFNDDEDKCLNGVLRLKSALIGSNRRKRAVAQRQGVLQRLLDLIKDASRPQLRLNAAHVLGSIAKGADVSPLIEAGAAAVLIDAIHEADVDAKLVEAALSCLRTLFQHPEAPFELLYDESRYDALTTLIALMTTSSSNQISAAIVLANACKTLEHQTVLAERGLAHSLNALLASPHADVQLPALQCLACLVFGNRAVAERVNVSSVLPLMGRDRPVETQLAAARCLAYLYRCQALDDNDPVIVYKALPCLVRVTKKEETPENRILAAETLSYLIEASAELQRIAAISNHLIPSMASFVNGSYDVISGNNNNADDSNSALNKEMQRAAFRVFGALAANDEDIRKRIIETDNLMPSLVAALDETDNPKLQMAAIGCLHSLSRSVQLLRTTFQDHPVWKPLMKLLSGATSPIEPLIVASSTLCNLLLEFSPSKEPILDSGAVEMLCHLTHKYESSLRLNGVWGLMNMAFQAEQRIKVQIIKSLGEDQIFRLLSDQDINVVMKTLGLLRNLLSNKGHIDDIMRSYGKHVMQVRANNYNPLWFILTEWFAYRPSCLFWKATTSPR